MAEQRNIIKGADRLISYFGKLPSFHDAEIIEVKLERQIPSLELKLYTFLTSNEVNEKGQYKQYKHCVVTIHFSGIEGLEINDFNQQNVIFGIDFEQQDKYIKVKINPSYGFSAIFNCKEIEIVSIAEKNMAKK